MIVRQKFYTADGKVFDEEKHCDAKKAAEQHEKNMELELLLMRSVFRTEFSLEDCDSGFHRGLTLSTAIAEHGVEIYTQLRRYFLDKGMLDSNGEIREKKKGL